MMQAPATNGNETAGTRTGDAPPPSVSAAGTLVLFALALALMLQPGDGRDDWVLAGDRLASAQRYTLALTYYSAADAGGIYGGGLDLRVARVHLTKRHTALAEEWQGRAERRCAAAQSGPLWGRAALSGCLAEARLLLGLLRAGSSNPGDAALLLSQGMDGGAAEVAYPLSMVRLRLGQSLAANDLLQAEAGRGDQRAQIALALLSAPSDSARAATLLSSANHGPDALAASLAARLITEESAWEMAEDSAYRALLVGRSALKASMPEVALAAFAEASRLRPDYAQAFAYQAFAHHVLGDEREALAACDAALGLDPRDPQALHTRGLVLWKQGRLPDALDALQSAAAADPGNAAVLSDLGDLHAALHQYDQAASDLAAAVQLDPSSPEPLLRLARFHLGSLVGVPLGLEAARSALTLAPESGEATDLLGWGLYLTGAWDDAVSTLQRAVLLAPSSAEAHYHLGMAEWRSGDTAAARDALQRAADLDSTGSVEARALEAMSLLR